MSDEQNPTHPPEPSSAVNSTDESLPPQGVSSDWGGVELNTEELFEQWSREEQLDVSVESGGGGRRFSVGRSPLMLGLVIALSLTLSALSFPALESLLKRDQVEDCGDVSKRRGAQDARPFEHLERCQLTAFVGTSDLFSIGRPETPDDPDILKRKAGVSYVVKLSGDQVYAILPADHPAIDAYYSTQGDLAGFGIDERYQLNQGLMIDPELEGAYQALEREIRTRLGVSLERKVWFFDVTYDPWDHKMPIIISLVGPLIALLALISLRNELRLRRQAAQDEADDEAWISEFDQALSDYQAQLAGAESGSAHEFEDDDAQA